MAKHLCAICGDYIVKEGRRRHRNGRRFGGTLVHRRCIPTDKKERMLLLARFRSGDFIDKRSPRCKICALRQRVKLLEKELEELNDEYKNLQERYES
jgi:hypothetical protein